MGPAGLQAALPPAPLPPSVENQLPASVTSACNGIRGATSIGGAPANRLSIWTVASFFGNREKRGSLCMAAKRGSCVAPPEPPPSPLDLPMLLFRTSWPAAPPFAWGRLWIYVRCKCLQSVLLYHASLSDLLVARSCPSPASPTSAPKPSSKFFISPYLSSRRERAIGSPVARSIGRALPSQVASAGALSSVNAVAKPAQAPKGPMLQIGAQLQVGAMHRRPSMLLHSRIGASVPLGASVALRRQLPAPRAAATAETVSQGCNWEGPLCVLHEQPNQGGSEGGGRNRSLALFAGIRLHQAAGEGVSSGCEHGPDAEGSFQHPHHPLLPCHARHGRCCGRWGRPRRALAAM
jgi:hypothetical protein